MDSILIFNCLDGENIRQTKQKIVSSIFFIDCKGEYRTTVPSKWKSAPKCGLYNKTDEMNFQMWIGGV